MNTRIALAAVAVGAALLGGADVGSAPSAGADPGTDLDPLQDLFGNTEFNSWTTMADTDLTALSPTLASGFDTSVDNWQGGLGADTLFGGDTFTMLAGSLDHSAFSEAPSLGGLPDNAIGDLAVGLDYTLFASGLESLDNELLLLLGSLFAFPA